MAAKIDITLQWRHNGRDGISNHQPHGCLPNYLFRPRSKKTSKLCVTGLWARNSPVTGEFPAQMASNAEKFPFEDVIMKSLRDESTLYNQLNERKWYNSERNHTMCRFIICLFLFFLAQNNKNSWPSLISFSSCLPKINSLYQIFVTRLLFEIIGWHQRPRQLNGLRYRKASHGMFSLTEYSVSLGLCTRFELCSC